MSLAKEAGNIKAKLLRAHQAITGDTSRETADKVVSSLGNRSKSDMKTGLRNLQGFKGMQTAQKRVKEHGQGATDWLAIRPVRDRSGQSFLPAHVQEKIESSHQKGLKEGIKNVRKTLAAREASEKLIKDEARKTTVGHLFNEMLKNQRAASAAARTPIGAR